MIFNVNSEDVASQIVKLMFGSRLEGIINGNVANPNVNTTPTTVRLENKKAKPARLAREQSAVSNGITTAKIGAIHSAG